MTRKQKQLIYYVGIAILLTILWNVVLRVFILPNQFVQTKARVVALEDSSPTISGGGRQVNTYPIYAYTSIDGEKKVFVSNDGFNRYNSFLFGKHEGQLVTAYLDKGSPDSEPFITRTGDWFILLFAPLILAIMPFGLVYVIILYFINKRHAH